MTTHQISDSRRDAASPARVVIASVMGQIVEYFDFALYGLLAVHIGRTFFPSGNTATELLSAFAVFGAAFLARPLGGLVLGPLGDRIGRKTVLVLSVTIISLSTFFVGLVPGADVIGIWAPIIVILLRLLQGFSAGGEFISALTYVTEHAATNRRGLYTGFIQTGSTSSFLLASLLILGLQNIFPADAFSGWAWRIPFLLALPLGVVALYIRLKLEESPAFIEVQKQGTQSKAPLKETFTKNSRRVFQGVGIAAFIFVGNYIFLTFMPSFLQSSGFNPQEAFTITTVGFVVNMVAHPLMGLLSDRVGRKQVAIGAALYLMVLSWPLFAIMSGANFATAIVCVTFFAIGVAGAVGAPSTIFVEMNPTRTRMATFAVGYNIGGALFGGTAVFVAQLLVTLTGDPRATAYYLIIAAVISLITLLTVRKYIRTGQPLDLFDGIPVPDESPLAGRSGNPLRAS